MKNKKLNYKAKSNVIKLLSEDSKFLGFYKRKDSLLEANKLNVDLVEINYSEGFSICKLIKLGKFLYLKSKKEKKKLKKKKVNISNKKKMKEIKVNLFISNKDLNSKFNKIKKIFEKCLNFKVLIVVRGRAVYKLSIIKKLIEKIYSNLKKYGKLLKKPNETDKVIMMVFFNSNKKCFK